VSSKTAAVGIIANPASGSDIRRLVALGSVFGSQEKINIIQRTLAGLAVTGIDRLYLMPDAFQIGESALGRLPQNLEDFRRKVQILDMHVKNRADDSIRAAHLMRASGVGCIIVLGGDGTSRAVAKGCGDVPILPISTGTNNVISFSVEGTVAGLAAGFVARYPEKLSEIAYRSKWLEICLENDETDLALVDIAVVEGQAIGSRAVWEPEKLKQAILTRAEPTTTGVSGMSGFIQVLSPYEPRGLSLRFGEPRICRITAPFAPGLMASFGVEEILNLSIGEQVIVEGGPCILALDGEREILLRRGQSARIILRQNGPWIVDVFQALQMAARQKFLVS
jgi:ATP-NAD kinase N-terminal domain